MRALIRFAPIAGVGRLLILVAAWIDGPWQEALWIAALALIHGSALIGRGQGRYISPAQFTQRYGLIVIVALGESVIAIGVGASDVRLDRSRDGRDPGHRRGRRALVGEFRRDGGRAPLALADERRDADRLARDLYSYLHLPMIAGIVLFALGLEERSAVQPARWGVSRDIVAGST